MASERIAVPTSALCCTTTTGALRLGPVRASRRNALIAAAAVSIPFASQAYDTLPAAGVPIARPRLGQLNWNDLQSNSYGKPPPSIGAVADPEKLAAERMKKREREKKAAEKNARSQRLDRKIKAAAKQGSVRLCGCYG